MKHGPRVGVLRGPSHPLQRNPVTLPLVLVLAAVAGCSGTSPASPSASATQAQTKTPIVIGRTSVPSSLHPFKQSWSPTSAGIGGYVFMLQPDGTATSRFVDKVQRTDGNNWTMTVKEGPKFSDSSMVGAKVLADGLNVIQKNSPLSNASDGVITLTPEGTTLKAHTERPTADLASILSERSNIVFKASNGNKVKSIDAGYQYFGRPNLTSGPLSKLKVRQTLDKGLNCNAYVKALKGGAVAAGTFARD